MPALSKKQTQLYWIVGVLVFGVILVVVSFGTPFKGGCGRPADVSPGVPEVGTRGHDHLTPQADNQDDDNQGDDNQGEGSAVVGKSCKDILEKGLSEGDGLYTIDPDGDEDKDPFEVFCDMSSDKGGWTIVDLNRSPQWQGYFTSYQTYTSGQIVGPSNQSDYPSDYSWRTWFGLTHEEMKFRVSEGCQNVTAAEDGRVYKMTGSVYGCKWYNKNCPETNGTCHQCTDPYNQANVWGDCGHLDAAQFTASSKYSYSQGSVWTCQNHWWNNAPSIGLQGKFCVGYR